MSSLRDFPGFLVRSQNGGFTIEDWALETGRKFGFKNTDVTLGAGVTTQLMIRTTDKAMILLERQLVGTTEKTRLRIYEEPTVTEDGTEVTDDISQQNRLVAIGPSLRMFANPTLSNNGKLIAERIGRGQETPPAFSTVSLSDPRSRLILKPNTVYMSEATNMSLVEGQFDNYAMWIEIEANLLGKLK